MTESSAIRSTKSRTVKKKLLSAAEARYRKDLRIRFHRFVYRVLKETYKDILEPEAFKKTP